MRVRSAAIRSQSGGSGQLEGGDGQTKVFEVLTAAKLKWNFSRGIHKPEGANGGKAAIGPEIFCQKPGQDKQPLGDCGELTLEPGDQVVVHSSGGGGFGEATAP